MTYGIKLHADLKLEGVERRLVLALDGVAWQSIEELRAEEGLFQIFSEPSRLISTFPTTTGPAMVQLLKANPTPGYENLYFDPNTRALGGGIKKYIGKRKSDPVKRGYNHKLDYEEPLPFEFLVYVIPDLIWEADFQRFFGKYEKVERKLYVAFLKSTDGVIHMGSRSLLYPALRELDRRLIELYQRHQGKLEIVVYSDHGNYMESCQRVRMERQLTRAGFKIASKLRSSNSVVAPAFGLCSYAALYTEPANLNDIANVLKETEGIDFSIYKLNGSDKIKIVGNSGTALVDYNPAERAFRYYCESGDPLKLATIAEQLRKQGALDPAGFANDQAWFNATRDHYYPDILMRLRDSLSSELVDHPANILVSLQDGYYWGNLAFDMIGHLAATHGNATAATSYAFLMSTHRQPPTFLRTDEACAFLIG
ncbi:MAG: hypothetical protein AB1489_23480 [Acidobacteriota bacterium]